MINISLSRSARMAADIKIVADGFGLHMNHNGTIVEIHCAVDADAVVADLLANGVNASLVKEKIFLNGDESVPPILANHGAENLTVESITALSEYAYNRPDLFENVASDEALQSLADAVRSILPHVVINVEFGSGDERYSESYQPVPASAEEISSGPVSELAPEIAQALGITPKGKGRGR